MAEQDFNQFFLEDTPEAAFNAFISPLMKSPLNKRILPGLFDSVYGQFLGSMGQQAGQGTLDLLNLPKFNDFLQAGQTPQQMLFSIPRFSRGAHASFFNPRTRFLFV